MIYTCWNCGWSCNNRQKASSPDQIGRYLLYDDMCFCSEYCIDDFKRMFQGNRPRPQQAHSGDWYENGYYGEWKRERKVKRGTRPKNRHGHAINKFPSAIKT